MYWLNIEVKKVLEKLEALSPCVGMNNLTIEQENATNAIFINLIYTGDIFAQIFHLSRTSALKVLNYI